MKRPTVLLVEDDPDMRAWLAEALTDEGFTIDQAANGADAMRYVQGRRPAAIVTDLRMPGGGWEYVAALVQGAGRSPVLLMTAFGDAVSRRRALRVGVAAYFDKPVRMAEILAVLERMGRPSYA